ncbi:MAG: S-adenosylmethionine:tRNA ribosyltransferase-isomerase [Lentimicrobiaceae bacterium]|nr:S-adenosylmethionine:tRNA ribosyltransferase-isomerase [Lentimicrobiaceae bacterium]
MIKDVQNISIEDYNYPLPDERIAKYPLSERDASKLLVLKDNNISSSHFNEIGDFLPKDSLLIFNETKVVRARLQFTKESGAAIEIFCLEPISGNGDYQVAFSSKSPSRWKCLVGNSRRWKNEAISLRLYESTSQQVYESTSQYQSQCQILHADRLEKNDSYSVVEFSWEPAELSFAEVLEAAGEIPLPPYLHREAEESDRERYQTVFAKHEGSVAAPTAGLHFTNELITNLKERGITFEEVTLHVGAGTFRPVSSETIGEHEMHSETIVVKKSFIENLIRNCDKTIIPVGTTSMRTIESLYWIGLMLMEEGLEERNLHLNQWFPYQERETLPSAEESLSTILEYLNKHELSELHATTALMIAPTCKINIAKALITNFHQPKSTLLLLVSALIGNKWKEAYQYALDNDFRFLSYGDSCLFLG